MFNDLLTERNVMLSMALSPVDVDSVTTTIPANLLGEYILCENPLPVPDFSFTSDTACPDICVAFFDESLNQPTSWRWQFAGADSAFSIIENPLSICYHHSGDYTVKLTVENTWGSSSITKIIHLLNSCPDPDPEPVVEEQFFIPNVFTPNGDHFNDEFTITGLPDEFILHVFNRWGQEMFSSTDKSKRWKGKDEDNSEVPGGVYYYELVLHDKKLNGFVHVIR